MKGHVVTSDCGFPARQWSCWSCTADWYLTTTAISLVEGRLIKTLYEIYYTGMDILTRMSQDYSFRSIPFMSFKIYYELHPKNSRYLTPLLRSKTKRLSMRQS